MVAGPGAEHPAGIAWVVGSSGLLGSAVCRRLRTLGREVVTTRVPWSEPEAAVSALLASAVQVERKGDGSWQLWWCAGAGVVGTSAAELDAEGAILEDFLDRWQPGEPSRARQQALFLASSAGGVYAGSTGTLFSESTHVVAVAPYGHAKLRAETAVEIFAARTGVATMVGRFSNLYGPGQDLAKPQGLISHLCRAQLTRQPLSIYVPLDTMRDYLFVDDAAAMAVAGLDAASARGGWHLKVLASERSTTIGGVLGDLRRITRRRPPVVLGSSASAGSQAHHLRFRSTAWPSVAAYARTPLMAGMAATLSSVGEQVRTARRPR